MEKLQDSSKVKFVVTNLQKLPHPGIQKYIVSEKLPKVTHWQWKYFCSAYTVSGQARAYMVMSTICADVSILAC